MSWKDEYLKILDSTIFCEGDIEKAQRIKINNLPGKIFKYRAINEFSLDNLASDSVWVNSPSEYNDPYEFYEKNNIDSLFRAIEKKHFSELVKIFLNEIDLPKNILDQANDYEEPIAFVTKYILKSSSNYSESEIDNLVGALNSITKQNVQEKLKEKIWHTQSMMKVCSFCESPDVLLMWSHYADSHKGMCIEYDIERWRSDDIRKRLLFPVIYSDQIYDSTKHLENYILNSDFNNLYPIISGTRKSLDWGYEKEWRLIFQIGPSFESQNYPMNCQSKVYLGMKMNAEDKNKVIDICQRKNIEVYETELDNENMKLKFMKIQQPSR